jgi:hypothetical protein
MVQLLIVEIQSRITYFNSYSKELQEIEQNIRQQCVSSGNGIQTKNNCHWGGNFGLRNEK